MIIISASTATLILYLFLWGLGFLILYTVIKLAVRNGVREAIEKQEQHLQEIKDLVFALTKDKYSKSEE